jgi:hypothetical protein
MLEGLADKALNIIAITMVVLVLGGGMAAATWAYMGFRRYKQFVCRVWSKDAFGQLVETKDDAGIFVDRKTKNKRLFLRKAKVGLRCDKVPYVPVGNKKVIYLLRTGLKNFRFIDLKISNPDVKLKVGEEDVNAYAKQKAIFSQNLWLQYLPFITIAFVTIVIMVTFIFFFRKLDTLEQFGLHLENMAKAIPSNSSMVITESLVPLMFWRRWRSSA